MKNTLVLDTIILILICGHSSKPPFIGLDFGFFLPASGTLSSAVHACLVQAAFQGEQQAVQEMRAVGKWGCLGLKTSRADGWSGGGADIEHSC